MKQERDFELTNHGTVPSTQPPLRSKRTPKSSRAFLYPGGEGIATFDDHQTSIIIPSLAEQLGEAGSYLSNIPNMVQIWNKTHISQKADYSKKLS